MEDEEKRRKALEIYQNMVDALAGEDDIPGVIDIVNTLIGENGLSPKKEAAETRLKAPEAKSAGNGDGRPVCPICGSPMVKKNGSSRGRKRYFCRHCHTYFGETTGKMRSHSRADDMWAVFLEGMLCGDTLQSLSEKCGIGIATAYSWRMKLFSQVSNSVEGKILAGIIQEDEFYLSSSFKGNKKCLANLGIERDYTDYVPDYCKYGFRSGPHERGGEDNKRGLSKDKVCVATAIDEGKNVIGKPVGRGNVSCSGLAGAFSGRMDASAVLVTDKSKAGASFAEESGLAHLALDAKTESRKGEYNLQLVNSLHSVISGISHSRCCFSTKNTEAYVTWEAWKILNRKRPLADKVNVLENLVTVGKKVATDHQIRHAEFPKVLQVVPDTL
jgi:transposase-like protein